MMMNTATNNKNKVIFAICFYALFGAAITTAVIIIVDWIMQDADAAARKGGGKLSWKGANFHIHKNYRVQRGR